MEVRSYAPEDAAPLAEVYHKAVREGAAKAYRPEQVAAWSPEVPRGDHWAERLGAADTVVAVEAQDHVGFMTMDARGYLDLAFVVPDVMGTGVSDALYAVLEGRARSRGVACLSTQASLLAEPFFARHGWEVVRRQEVEMGGVVLENAWMEKRL